MTGCRGAVQVTARWPFAAAGTKHCVTVVLLSGDRNLSCVHYVTHAHVGSHPFSRAAGMSLDILKQEQLHCRESCHCQSQTATLLYVNMCMHLTAQPLSNVMQVQHPICQAG